LGLCKWLRDAVALALRESECDCSVARLQRLNWGVVLRE
jgi:hypothetical protein